MCLGSAQHLKSKFGKGYQLELKVQTVDRTDTDFEHYVKELQEVSKGRAALTTSAVSTAVLEDEEACPTASAADIYLNLEEAKAALAQITGDEALSQMIDAKDPIGFTVYKDAMSVTGVDALSLAAFCCTEIRMRKLEMFISMKFPIHVLRERQDNKARYEVDCESDSEPVKISSIFASIEEYKEKLRLADYSVSQTSLEQVFNMHAAEAERMKLCQIDG